MTNDLELLRAWQAGDRRAGDALLRRHFARVYAFFGARLGSDAGDLVQRTFLACVESQQRLDVAEDFPRYLTGICRKVLLGHLRRRHLEGRVSLRGSIERGRSTHAPATVDRLGAGEDGRRIASALDQLGTDDQLALRLYYWEDWSVAAIAEVLGASRAAVKFRLFRARRRLEAALARVGHVDAGAQALTRRSGATS